MMNREQKLRELEARKQRAIEAEKLLNNPLMSHALQEMENEAVTALKSLDSSNIEKRDILWRDLQAANRFRSRFIDYVKSGKEADTLLQRLLKGEI